MITHYKYEFTDRADMLKDLSKYFVDGVFNSGHIVELGYTYDEGGNEITGYLVDILWTISPPMRLSKEIYPDQNNHEFSGLGSEWTKSYNNRNK